MFKTDERKRAMEYTVYMMMGSYFKKATYAQKLEEKNLRICYTLLNQKYQLDLETCCEEYFLKEVQPDLSPSFLESEVYVRRFETKNKNAAITFSNGENSLWIVIKPGRRGELPKFEHCILKREELAEEVIAKVA